ncbi:MAG TPA: hypothetical protein VIU40_06030 [Geobacteraceae bacterium]
MRRIAMIFAAAAMCMALGASRASAVGVGGYLELGGGSGEFEFSDISNSEFDVDASYGGLGFVLDTSPGGTGVFSYRLNVGFEGLTLDPDDFDDNIELGGFVIDNTFAFAVVRAPAVRVWVGPQIRLAYYSGETENSNLDTDLGAFGIGLAAGANIYPNPQGRFALAPSLGFRRVGYAGEMDDGFGGTDDLEGYTNLFYLNLAVLFGR